MGAGAVFLLVGGPVRVARGIRRHFFPSDPEKAYDALPKPMQAWVDHMAGAVGPRAADTRQILSEELQRWRHDPKKHGKISKKLAKQIAEGPPGPRRVARTAFEAGAAIVTAALARKMVERFLSGEPPSGVAPLDAAGTIGARREAGPEARQERRHQAAKQRARRPRPTRARTTPASAREAPAKGNRAGPPRSSSARPSLAASRRSARTVPTAS